jgi:hypothetical protein
MKRTVGLLFGGRACLRIEIQSGSITPRQLFPVSGFAFQVFKLSQQEAI